MGTFFTNVHVRAGSGGAEATRAAVLEALKELAARNGLVPCDGDTDGDHSIVVGPAGPWIAVLDEATESQDVEQLDALAKELSARAGSCALAALVHDSDHLLLHLFEDGRLLDEIDRGKKKGQLEVWSKLVSPEALGKLRARFASRDLFAERTMEEIATILGVDERTACTGYRYLRDDGVDLEGATWLHFRHAERPAHERRAEGPPNLMGPAAPGPYSTAVGACAHCVMLLINQGGASRGLRVVVHGEAIDAGLVKPEVVRILSGSPYVVTESKAEQRTLKNGKAGFVADLPEAQIPAGNAQVPEAPMKGLSVERLVDFSTRTQMQTVVEARALAPGEGTFFVAISTTATPDLAVQFPIQLTVAPPTRKPLRGKSDDPSHYLALDLPETLVGLAMSTVDVEEAASIAAEIVERWSALWPVESELTAVIFGGGRTLRPTKPRKLRMKVSGLAQSAGWKKVKRELATANCVGAHGAREGDSFAFGRSVVRSPFAVLDGPERDIVTLRLGVDLRGRADVAEVVSRARSLVDEFVLRARCTQGVLARWRATRASHALDSTPYELACGVHGQCTLQHAWATRFLRGVGADGLWLGPELLAHIDRKALEPIANTEMVGETLRVVLRPESTLDALEAVLAPLLPSPEDWKEGMQRRVRPRILGLPGR